MSHKEAVEFIKRVDSDPALLERVTTLDPTDGTSLISIARETGYQICVADFKSAAQSLGRTAGELTDVELDRVAGGAGGLVPLSAVQTYLVNFSGVFSLSSLNRS